MDRRTMMTATLGAAVAGRLVGAAPAAAQTAPPRTPLKRFDVTIRVFDPQAGLASGIDYVLPVDSPDEEHAAASTLANAASFTPKTKGGAVLPVAFCCTKVSPRG